MSITKNKIKKIESVLRARGGFDICFVKWDVPIDKKMEKKFIETKTNEIKSNFDSGVYFVFLDKIEVELYKF